MIFQREITIRTPARTAFLPVTGQIAEFVRETGVKAGSVLVFVPHTTAAVTINENADPDVIHDLKEIMARLVPWEGPYRHREGNSAAHMLASLLGASETLPVQDGKLLLGTWQGVYFAEFDGPRTRRLFIQVQGEIG